MREVLDTITSGQELDLRRFASASAQSLVALRTDEELDDYTYRVAGCVGEFWTKMCRAHLFPQAPLDDAFLLANGVRFGKGLQLVNILRDVAADLRNGRCYLPAERLAGAGLKPEDLLQPANEPRLRPLYHAYLDHAEAHLLAGWAYTNALPRRCVRVRLACAWPILIGRETLKRLRAGNALDPAQRIKVSRREVRQFMLRSVLLYPWPGAWEKMVPSRESCCVASHFAVKKPPCRFQNPSWSSARRHFARPSSRFVQPTLTCKISCKRPWIRNSANCRPSRLRPPRQRLFPPRRRRLPPQSRRGRSQPRLQRPRPPPNRHPRQSAGGPRRRTMDASTRSQAVTRRATGGARTSSPAGFGANCAARNRCRRPSAVNTCTSYAAGSGPRSHC